MDYSAWVRTALEFQARLGKQAGEWELTSDALPPINSKHIASLNARLQHKVPNAVRDFVLQGSGGLKCHYVWTPEGIEEKSVLKEIFPNRYYIYGGATLCNAREFEQLQSECIEAATETWIDDEPIEKEIWLNAFPFVRLPNGDMLALDLRGEELNPPVISLIHDGESSIISGSFDQFLENWAMIGYVGPENWLLEAFMDPATKRLVPEKTKAEKFCNLMTGKFRPFRA